MNETGAEPRATGRTVRAAAIVGLAAAIAYSWTTALHFQFDDHWLILAAPEQLRRVAQPFTDHGPLPALLEHLFQPVCWAWLEFDRFLSGEPLDARTYHVTSILVHVVTAVVGFLVIRRHVLGHAALLGGLVLAIWPAGAQAVSWSAARGDMLWVTCTALACLSARRFVLLSGLFVALGFAAKSSAWLSLPCVVLYALCVRRPSLARGVFDTLVLTIPLVLVAYVRARYLGTWSMLYLGGISAQSSQIASVVEAIPAAVGYALSPSNEAPATLQTWMPRVVGFAAWALVVTCLALRARSRPTRTMAALLAVAVPLAPAAFLWHFYPNAAGIYSSRALYPVGAGLAVLTAVALESTDRPSRVHSILRAAAVLLLAAVALDATRHVASLEIEGADRTRSRVASLVDAARAAPPDTTFVVADPHPDFHGVLMTHTQIATALRPPFVRETVPVQWSSDFDGFVEDGALSEIAGPAQFLRLEKARFVAASRVLPALEAEPPDLDRAGETRWIPTGRLTPRGYTSILVSSTRTDRRKLEVDILAGDRRFAHDVDLVAGRAAVSLQTSFDLATQQSITAIEVEAVGLDGEERDTLLDSLTLTMQRSLPRFTVVEPRESSILPLTSTPTFRFTDFPDGADLRLDLELSLFGARLPFRYVVPERALVRTGESIAYAPAVEHFLGPDGLPWVATMEKIHRELAKPNGIDSFGVTGVAFAVRGDTKVATSPRFSLTIDGSKSR